MNLDIQTKYEIQKLLEWRLFFAPRTDRFLLKACKSSNKLSLQVFIIFYNTVFYGQL